MFCSLLSIVKLLIVRCSAVSFQLWSFSLCDVLQSLFNFEASHCAMFCSLLSIVKLLIVRCSAVSCQLRSFSLCDVLQPLVNCEASHCAMFCSLLSVAKLLIVRCSAVSCQLWSFSLCDVLQSPVNCEVSHRAMFCSVLSLPLSWVQILVLPLLSNTICVFLFNKTNRRANFPKLFLSRNSTCFGQFLCQSSGVFHCTFGTGTCHAGLMTCTSAEGTVENSWWGAEEMLETCRISWQK